MQPRDKGRGQRHRVIETMLSGASGAKRIQAPISKRRDESSAMKQVKIGFIVLFGVGALVAVMLYVQILASFDDFSSPTIRQAEEKAALEAAAHLPANQLPSDLNKFVRSVTKQQIRGELEEQKQKEVLQLTLTNVGTIKIVLRPDFSQESVEYIHKIVQQGCGRCNFYRAEQPGILQGVVAQKSVPIPTVKGSCPAGYETVKNDCPEWDPHCACHGPVMERGHVAWAAGVTGPDFFINNYKEPAKWWGTQHTST